MSPPREQVRPLVAVMHKLAVAIRYVQPPSRDRGVCGYLADATGRSIQPIRNSANLCAGCVLRPIGGFSCVDG
jgi:hypothetical protein